MYYNTLSLRKRVGEYINGGKIMEFIGLFLVFVGGLVPSLLILIKTNDEKARIECLNSTYELGNEFERLSRIQRKTARTPDEDHNCLINIKNILQKLSVQKTGLIFSFYLMDKQVEESLRRIRRMDTTDENPHYHIPQTGTCVLLNWGKSERMRPEFKQLKEIQRFLQRSFPTRFCCWLRYLPFRMKDKLLKKCK